MENEMNGDQKMAVRIVTVIAVVLMSAIGGCTANSINNDRVITHAMEKGIAAGADPLLVACAYRPPADAARCQRAK